MTPEHYPAMLERRKRLADMQRKRYLRERDVVILSRVLLVLALVAIISWAIIAQK